MGGFPVDTASSAQLSYRFDSQDFAAAGFRFVAPEIRQRDDAAERHARLARIISAQIIPRLAALHPAAGPAPDAAAPPSDGEVSDLAHLVMGPDIDAAAAFVTSLRERGLPMETLFVELLEPAARHLGVMWERDECDFIDVTLGLGHLQELLAIFNCTRDIPALVERRRVLMTGTAGEQHSFGAAMVEKFLRAGGWGVQSAPWTTARDMAALVRSQWFAVAGLTLGSESHLDDLKAAIAAIRRHSCNRAIGVMVGGPVFLADPALAQQVGADATAVNAPTAVVVAQMLFDMGATAPRRSA